MTDKYAVIWADYFLAGISERAPCDSGQWRGMDSARDADPALPAP
jgi:hypothetical protein